LTPRHQARSRRLLLVRHGETDDNAQGRFLGRGDPHLNERGRCQARRLSRALASFTPDEVVTSPALRARQTVIEAAGSAVVTVDEAFREVDFGRWEGRTQAEVAALDPAGHDRFVRGPVVGFPDGDRVADVAQRLTRALERHPVARLAVVTHATTIRILVAYLLDIPVEHYRSRLERPGNGSWSSLEQVDGTWALVAYGVVPSDDDADAGRSVP
jgi:glucosyl-3-phosphoglycerate phosphatase